MNKFWHVAILLVLLTILNIDQAQAEDSWTPLESACKAGSLVDCKAIGKLPLRAGASPKDRMRLTELMTVACEGGDASSCLWLGGDTDPERARPFVTRARLLFEADCNSGDVHACVTFGNMLMYPRVLPPDQARAKQLFEVGCRANDARGCVFLALLYKDGIVVARDPVREAELYAKACSLGDTLYCMAEQQDGNATEQQPQQQQNAQTQQRQARLYCWTDFTDPDPVDKPTWCEDASGGQYNMNSLHPCYGVEGWCDSGD